MKILEVNQLNKNFGGLKVVQNLSFSAKEGEITSLIGTNGAGKTTSFHMISGFLAPTSGEIKFNSTDISGLKAYEIVKLGLVRTFQHTSLFYNLTVLENVTYILNSLLKEKISNWFFKTSTYNSNLKQINERGLQLLDRVGLLEVKDELVKNLSYGDQRKLTIAIGLASNPKLLMLDEPAAGLNPNESQNLITLIKSLIAEGISILLIEHDMKVVMSISDHIVVMDHGEKIAEGRPDEIQNNEEVRRIYLGAGV